MHRFTFRQTMAVAASSVAVAVACAVVGPVASDGLSSMVSEDGAIVGGVPTNAVSEGLVSLGGGVGGQADALGAVQADVTSATAGVAYNPEVALVRVREGATADELEAALEATSGVVAQAISDEELASGLVAVRLEPGTSVDDAIGALAASTDVIAGAQPDYAYTLLDAKGTAGDLHRVLDATDESKAELPEGEVMGALASKSGAKGSKSRKGAATTSSEGASALTGVIASATGVNDPRATSQWALSSLNAYEAWDKAKGSAPSSGPAVTVAVLDVGFDIDHEDLAANIVAPYNTRTGTSTTAALAGLSHGTHVAGIISAVSNNAVGVSGMSYNAQIMPIKVCGDSGVAYTSDLVKAYSYLMDRASANNVRVVNISMGGTGAALSSDDAFLSMIDKAYAAGIVTVAAAGNTDVAPAPYDCYPGDYGTVVSVMNLRQSGDGVVLDSSSNHNAEGETDKNISAPGTAILSTMPDDAYGSMTGTSMASPYVAGVMALEFAADPSLSAAEAKDVLYTTAKDLGASGFDATYGYGEADAAAVVTAVRSSLDARNEAAEEEARKAAEEEARKAAEEEARKAAEEEARKAAEEAERAEAERKAAEEQSARQVAEVRTLIEALPATQSLTLADKGQVEQARAAFEALSEEQRLQLDATQLVAAEQRIAALVAERAEAERKAAEEAERAEAERKAAEEEARKAAEEAERAEAERKAAEEEARKAAEEAERKATEEAERAEAERKAAEEEARKSAESQQQIAKVRRLIAALPSASRVRLADKARIVQARAAYDALTAQQQARINVARLVSAERRLAQLEAAQQSIAVSYRVHVPLFGWQQAVSNGSTARGLLFGPDAIALSLGGSTSVQGSIQYRSYVRGRGWRSWTADGRTSGSLNKALESMQVRLTGNVAESHDVCYRVYTPRRGWTSWVRNGTSAGTVNRGDQIFAVQVKVVAKGSAVS